MGAVISRCTSSLAASSTTTCTLPRVIISSVFASWQGPSKSPANGRCETCLRMDPIVRLLVDASCGSMCKLEISFTRPSRLTLNREGASIVSSKMGSMQGLDCGA
eukprot:scaffold978_cov164-Amphora_coffeaeformis.AAC.16